jgi:uncharacterized protein (DUF433 family)
MPTDLPFEALPLYSLREAAQVIGMPDSTLRGWARGYTYKGIAGQQTVQDPMITTSRIGRGAVVPFVGLAEGYVLNAFREAKVPMQRIRPAITRLEEQFGLSTALASRQLMTDGAEVLWQFGEETRDPELRDHLVVVRNDQMVFTEVIEQYLQLITYDDLGNVARIRLHNYIPEVVVDPRFNFGQPTLASRGIRVSDVVGRLTAGEDANEVAEDFLLDVDEVLALAA